MKSTFKKPSSSQPLIVLRADDPLTIAVLTHYRNLYGTGETNSNEKEFVDGIEAQISRVRMWQTQFPEDVVKHTEIENLTGVIDAALEGCVSDEIYTEVVRNCERLQKEVNALNTVNTSTTAKAYDLAVEIEKRDNEITGLLQDKEFNREQLEAAGEQIKELREQLSKSPVIVDRIKWSGSEKRIEANPEGFSLVVEKVAVSTVTPVKDRKPFKWTVFENGKIISPAPKDCRETTQKKAMKKAETFYLNHIKS